MSAHHLPSDAQMRAWRLSGQFICTCTLPHRRRVSPFLGAFECTNCWKPIVSPDQAAELVAVGLAANDDVAPSRIATFADGSQLLIEGDTAAIRPSPRATWGPPVPLEEAP